MATGKTLMYRLSLATVGIVMLSLSYLYQYTDVLSIISSSSFSGEAHFVVNRITRILLNDIGMICIIYSIFVDHNAVRLAVWIQVFDLFVLLPLYLFLKLPSEGTSELSSPFLSQLHRIVVNPILMILLIPALYYQKIGSK